MIKKWLFSAESELFLVFSAENSAKMLVLLSWNDKWMRLFPHLVEATTLIGEHRDVPGFAVPTVNHIVGLVGKEDVTLCVGSGPFGKSNSIAKKVG